MEILGIDIGGSGIKGALVNVDKGEMVTERHRIPTPQPATPDAVAGVVAQIARHFSWDGLVGCTFPAIMKQGVAHSAANVDKSWIGTDAAALFQHHLDAPVWVVNDADAAGMAEMQFGAGKGRTGVIFMLTIGTGIGSAIIVDGHLLPNSELGHLQMGGIEAENFASDRVRKKEDLSWKKWTKRFNAYLQYLEFLFSPNLFILGGGVVKKWDKFSGRLSTQAAITPATLGNNAGIVGAALVASMQL